MRALMFVPVVAAMLAVKAAAVTTIVSLGVVAVPPTQTFSPGVTFTSNGVSSAYYEFAVSQPLTTNASSFTNTAVGRTGVFKFTSIGLYAGTGIGGTLLETGTIGARLGGTMQAYLDPYTLSVGHYTIAYTGTASGKPASVGSSITFAAGAVPEPASWMMMVAGFGLIGFSVRKRSNTVAA
jgi:hypothetical protein